MLINGLGSEANKGISIPELRYTACYGRLREGRCFVENLLAT